MFPFFISRRFVFYVVGARKARTVDSRLKALNSAFFQVPLSPVSPISDTDRRLRLENLFENYNSSRIRAGAILGDIAAFNHCFKSARTQLVGFKIPSHYEVDPPDLEKRIMRLLAYFHPSKIYSRIQTPPRFFAHLCVAPRPAVVHPTVVSNVKSRYGNNDLYLYVVSNFRPVIKKLRYLWSTCFDSEGLLYRDHLLLFPRFENRSAIHAMLDLKAEQYYELQDRFRAACGRRSFTKYKDSLVIPCYGSKTLSCYILSRIIFTTFPGEPYSPTLTPHLPNVSLFSRALYTNPYFFMALESDPFYPPLPPLLDFYLSDPFYPTAPLHLGLSSGAVLRQASSFLPDPSSAARRSRIRFNDIYTYVFRLRYQSEKYVPESAPWLTTPKLYENFPSVVQDYQFHRRRLDTLTSLRYQKLFCDQVSAELSPTFSYLDDFRKQLREVIEAAGPGFRDLFKPDPNLYSRAPVLLNFLGGKTGKRKFGLYHLPVGPSNLGPKPASPPNPRQRDFWPKSLNFFRWWVKKMGRKEPIGEMVHRYKWSDEELDDVFSPYSGVSIMPVRPREFYRRLSSMLPRPVRKRCMSKKRRRAAKKALMNNPTINWELVRAVMILEYLEAKKKSRRPSYFVSRAGSKKKGATPAPQGGNKKGTLGKDSFKPPYSF